MSERKETESSMDRKETDIVDRLTQDADLFAVAGLGGDENDGALYGGVDFETKVDAEFALLGDLHEAVTAIEGLRTSLVNAVEEGTTKLADLREEVRVLRGGNPPEQAVVETGRRVADRKRLVLAGKVERLHSAWLAARFQYERLTKRKAV